MMYPRLYLARNLLREDGVIFISIDDNEVANLRLLMDQIFGEENFIGAFIWKSRHNVDSHNKTGISNDHEYVLAYGSRVRGKEVDKSKYSNPDNEPRGPWMSDNLVGLATAEQRPNLHYDLIDPATNINYGRPGKGWRYTSAGTQEIRQIFGFDAFNFPKPLDLLKLLIEQTTSDNDIVLDFFAGSCPIAHALLDLNQEDGSNRKFICIQYPEETPENSPARNAGYNTIADIDRARIRKVIERMNAERAAQLPLGERPTLGFRAFKLAPSNFKIWRSDLKTKEEILAQLEFHLDPTLNGNEEYMLWELLLKAGYPLSAKVETRQIEGVTIYDVEDGQVAFAKRTTIALQALNPAVIEAVRQSKPQVFICLDKLFNKDDQLKTNTGLQMKEDGITFQSM